MIDFGLDEDLQMIRDTVADFAAEQLRPNLREFEDAGGVSDEVRNAYHEMGMTSLAVPESCGGQGLGLRAHAIVVEELAVGDIGAATDLDRSGGTIHVVTTLGSDEQQQELLSGFGDTSNPAYTGSLCWHEPVAGISLEETATTASADGAEANLSGTKMLVAAAADTDFFVVTARIAGTEGLDGIRVYAVKKDASGITIGDADRKVGLETLTTNTVTFENTPGTLLAESTDLGKVQTALRKVQALGAARTAGMVRGATEYSVWYAKDREAFGKPIHEHQAIAFKIADMGIATDAARWNAWRAIAVLEDGESGAEEVPSALMEAAEAARFCCGECVQILGGHGFIQDHPAEKWMRDARAQENLYGIAGVQAIALSDVLLG